MDITLITPDNKTSEKLSVNDEVFGREYNEPLIHQVVVAYQAGGRQGTKAQKNRSAVSGGGAKPWRQKGTGRARAGTSRGPLWRKGGVTFAAQPRDHSHKVNRKMYRGAMRSIMSFLVEDGRLVAVKDLTMSTPKTKDLAKTLKALNVEKVLIVASEVDKNLFLSARNLSNVDVIDVQAVNPVCLMSYHKVIMTVPAIKQVEEMLG